MNKSYLREKIKQGLSFFKHRIYLTRLKRYKKKASCPAAQFKVLVVMNGGVGNAVEAAPLVQAIRMLWPKAHITIYPPGGDLFDGWCIVDRIIASSEQLEGQSYDHTFMCSGPMPEAASVSLGKIHNFKCFLWKWFLKPEREYYMDMIKRLGYRGITPPLYVSIKPSAAIIASSTMRIAFVPGGKPDYKWRYKRWPYYHKLAEAIISKYPNIQICIIGTEKDDISGMPPANPMAVDLRGRLSLSETAWVLKHSNIIIGNDCGAMHIADAVQTKSLRVFGPTCELKNAPLHKTTTISLNIPCSPCQYDDLIIICQTPKCITDLSAEFVLSKIEFLMKTMNF